MDQTKKIHRRKKRFFLMELVVVMMVVFFYFNCVSTYDCELFFFFNTYGNFNRVDDVLNQAWVGLGMKLL